MKKVVANICRDCGNACLPYVGEGDGRRAFRGKVGSYRCTDCAKKEALYREQRERMRRALPFFLKTST